jgi:hypothetical protein
VPPRAVGHGSVRIPLWLAQGVFEWLRIDTPVIFR